MGLLSDKSAPHDKADAQCLRMLVEAGAQIKMPRNQPGNPLALVGARPAVLEAMLELKADVDAGVRAACVLVGSQSLSFLQAPLVALCARSESNPDDLLTCVELLLSAKSDVNQRDQHLNVRSLAVFSSRSGVATAERVDLAVVERTASSASGQAFASTRR